MYSLREIIDLFEGNGQLMHVARQVSGDEVAAIVWELNERKERARQFHAHKDQGVRM